MIKNPYQIHKVFFNLLDVQPFDQDFHLQQN